jgi:hypothetical protein
MGSLMLASGLGTGCLVVELRVGAIRRNRSTIGGDGSTWSGGCFSGAGELFERSSEKLLKLGRLRKNERSIPFGGDDSGLIMIEDVSAEVGGTGIGAVVATDTDVVGWATWSTAGEICCVSFNAGTVVGDASIGEATNVFVAADGVREDGLSSDLSSDTSASLVRSEDMDRRVRSEAGGASQDNGLNTGGVGSGRAMKLGTRRSVRLGDAALVFASSVPALAFVSCKRACSAIILSTVFCTSLAIPCKVNGGSVLLASNVNDAVDSELA